MTCSRCGKENQNHYKFCLGCGARLEAGGAAPAAVPNEPPATPVRQRTPGPANLSGRPGETSPAVVSGVIGGAPSGRAPGMTSPRPGGTPGVGIPSVVISDVSPMQGTGLGDKTMPDVALAATVAPPPAGGSGLIPIAAPNTAVGGAVVPAAQNKDGGEMVICPKCGKTVSNSFAFCGACGQRLKPAAAGASPVAPAAPRTMFMGAQAPKATARGHLTLIRPDGTEGGMHPLHDGENLIGRGQGSLFDADPYLSPRHAEFVLGIDGLTVRDLRSLNGVFLRIGPEEQLESGDIFRIGQELLRFDLISAPGPLEDGTEIIGTPNPGYWGRISVIVGRDVDGPAFPLFDDSIVLGRERGDILFPEDGYVSGTHAQITLRDGQVFLSDLGSSNGTFFRLRGSRSVSPGSLILMGQQLFRIAYR